MRSGARTAGFVLLLLGALGAAVALSRRAGVEQPAPTEAAASAVPAPRASDPLAAVPSGALLVVSLDVRTLRRTALGERLLGRGRRLPGLGALIELCGRDPMDGVDRLVLAVPAERNDVGFGLVASGSLDGEGLVTCARQLIEKRGGRADVARVGRFQVVRDASSAAPGAALAVAPGGPVLVAEEVYLQAGIEASEGRRHSARDDADHQALRQRMRPGTLLATVVLTPELRRTLDEELTAQGSQGSPFSAVSGAAASLDLGDPIHLEVALRCEPADRCQAVANTLARARDERAEGLADAAPRLAQAMRATTVAVTDGLTKLELTVSPLTAMLLVDELLGPAAEPAPVEPPPAAAPSASGGGSSRPSPTAPRPGSTVVPPAPAPSRPVDRVF